MENVILRTERVEMKFPCDFICAEDVVRAIGNEETYAKDGLKMKTINAYVIEEHIKSRALLERLGFEQKELMKDNTENKGKLVDRYHYELKL